MFIAEYRNQMVIRDGGKGVFLHTNDEIFDTSVFLEGYDDDDSIHHWHPYIKENLTLFYNLPEISFWLCKAYKDIKIQLDEWIFAHYILKEDWAALLDLNQYLPGPQPSALPFKLRTA